MHEFEERIENIDAVRIKKMSSIRIENTCTSRIENMFAIRLENMNARIENMCMPLNWECVCTSIQFEQRVCMHESRICMQSESRL